METLFNPDIEGELNDESLYRHMIKAECFICKSVFNPELLFSIYQIKGNCCSACSAKIEMRKRLKKYEDKLYKNKL